MLYQNLLNRTVVRLLEDRRLLEVFERDLNATDHRFTDVFTSETTLAAPLGSNIFLWLTSLLSRALMSVNEYCRMFFGVTFVL